MSRTPSAITAVPISLRMPAELLTEIDVLARRNLRDRTSEINNACKEWVKCGAVSKKDTSDAVPVRKDELKSAAPAVAGVSQELMTELVHEIQILNSRITAVKHDTAVVSEMKDDIAALAWSFEAERMLLHKVIEGYETTLNRLLQFAGKDGMNMQPDETDAVNQELQNKLHNRNSVSGTAAEIR